MKKLLLLLFLACAACSSEKRGLAELKRLCEKDAGLTIYKTVEANGFYNAYSNNGITDYLIKGPYKFYEFCDDSPSLSRNTLFPEPGCFRVKKTDRVNGQCDDRVDKALSKRIVDPYPEFLEQYCIEVEKIETPEAWYTYEIERKEWWVSKKHGTKMTWSVGRIINTKTKEVLGERLSYGLFPKGYGASRSKPHVGCGSYQVTGEDRSRPFATGLIEKVLISGLDKNKGDIE